MRFAHLADSHLGFKQLGLDEREEDLYEVFEKTIDKIIELNVDFVIHSGDLFNSHKPTTNTLLVFQKELLKLNDAGIPFYVIAGNHDSLMRKNFKPPILLFEELGLNIISTNRAYTEKGVLICGIQYIHKTQKKALGKNLEKMSALADKHEKSILVLHQGIDKVLPKGEYELELDEIPKNFNYYALGHIHDNFEQDYGKGKLVYPGSMEMHNSLDAGKELTKGFCLVDLTDDELAVERINIELPRKYFKEEIEYEKFNEQFDALKEKIIQENRKPLLDLKIVGGDFISSDIYEIITESLGDYVLNLRPEFKPDEVLRKEETAEDEKTLDARTLLRKRIDEKYGWDELTNLSIDLLENLSSRNVDDAKILSQEFYDENFAIEEGHVKTEEDN